jgi:hypothetical protein
MANITQSSQAYEAWLRSQLGADLVEEDLTRKHMKMRSSSFAFLRATYWRFAETVFDICPDFAIRTDGPGDRRYPSGEFRHLARCRRAACLGCQ